MSVEPTAVAAENHFNRKIKIMIARKTMFQFLPGFTCPH
jgi:hypothetical protein